MVRLIIDSAWKTLHAKLTFTFHIMVRLIICSSIVSAINSMRFTFHIMVRLIIKDPKFEEYYKQANLHSI